MPTLLQDIQQILQTARQKTYRAVNHSMVTAYWLMGKRIVEEEQKEAKTAAYGKQLLKILSRELTRTFGKGFSYASLNNYRQFYLTYPDAENLSAVRRDLSWTHHRTIMRLLPRKSAITSVRITYSR